MLAALFAKKGKYMLNSEVFSLMSCLTDMTLVSADLLAVAALALKDKREDGLDGAHLDPNFLVNIYNKL